MAGVAGAPSSHIVDSDPMGPSAKTASLSLSARAKAATRRLAPVRHGRVNPDLSLTGLIHRDSVATVLPLASVGDIL